MAAVSMMWSLVRVFMMCAVVHSQTCRERWDYYEGSCYIFGESQVTWGDAQRMCHDYNATLAEIEDAGENTFVKNLSREHQGAQNVCSVEYAHNGTVGAWWPVSNQVVVVAVTWLGGTDIFHEGIWHWVSTGALLYPFVDWAPAYPSDLQNADCLSFDSSASYQWVDHICYSLAYFICEAQAEGTKAGSEVQL